jgi:hypothetical protein
MSAVRSLAFEEEPQYAAYRSLFGTLIDREIEPLKFDWELLTINEDLIEPFLQDDVLDAPPEPEEDSKKKKKKKRKCTLL